jgi:hypothetical protein
MVEKKMFGEKRMLEDYSKLDLNHTYLAIKTDLVY